MKPVRLAQLVEERYRRYLETTFYFKDPDLRRSFQENLRSGRMRQRPISRGHSGLQKGSETTGSLQRIAGT